jgi:hypothetical protein
MKRFIIIYEKDLRSFTFACDADGFFSALHKFENDVKLNCACIISIDKI